MKRPLYSDYLQLVQKLASRLARKLPPSIAVEDLIQEGNIGLLQAIKRYDPKKNDNFPLYARQRIMGSMLDSIRCRHWFAATLAGLEDASTLQSPLDLAARTRKNEIGRRVYTATRQLSSKKRRVLQMLYVDGLPADQVAKRLYPIPHTKGLTEEQVAERLQVAVQRVEDLRASAVQILRFKLADLKPKG